MNYFRGNGGCGLTVSPEYLTRTKNSILDQGYMNESLSFPHKESNDPICSVPDELNSETETD